MLYRIAATTIILSAFFNSFSATADESPVEHMRQLSDREALLSTKYMSYMSEVAHGHRARKMEKRRQELIMSIRQAIQEGGRLRPYKGDASLRDAYKKYWSVLLSIFTDDYSKIIDMEEIAERSYDAMEAILLIQEKASETVDAAYKDVATAYKAFADNHDVKLIEGEESKLTGKLTKTGKVNHYLNQLYLIFFKSSVQETLALEALAKRDLNAAEQSRNSMLKFSVEGLLKLDTLKAFNGDASVKTACRQALEFHKKEVDKFSVLSDYLIKLEEFEKTKKAFEAIPASRRTQADVDAFNKSVREVNEVVTQSNKLSQELNSSRSKVLDNWEAARKKFMDHHIPHK
ncbi:MAG TPA: hypothetical protein VF141_08285 [Chryseolinea sp.]